MAECSEAVSKEVCKALLCRLAGMRVSMPWVGYAGTIFLELGKLHTETTTVRGVVKRRRRRGQVTLMIEPQWRVERPASIQFASGFPNGQIERGAATLKGLHLADVALTNGLPELELTFDDGRRLKTFTDFLAQPGWTIGVSDRSLLELAPAWDGVDVSPWLCVRAGRFIMSYCFDEAEVDVGRLRQFRFPRRKSKSQQKVPPAHIREIE